MTGQSLSAERARRVAAARRAMLRAVACHPRWSPVAQVLGAAIDDLDAAVGLPGMAP